jgi:sigma-B regulation protein RsbU (phosphoserine phosphatase)
MAEPKVFYRELDAILGRIRIGKRGQNFLAQILGELTERFGEALQFSASHLYELRGNEFVLVKSYRAVPGGRIASRLGTDKEAVRRIKTNGSFIFDDPALAQDFALVPGAGQYVIPAGIYVHSAERQWLFVFELRSGSVRDEALLFLNSVRTALNYRLFAEALNTELQQAAQIQQSLLPKGVPQVKGWEIAGCSRPAELVGGDFYDFFQFDEDSFGVAVGDASGHGLVAALLTRDVVVGLRMGLAKEMRIAHTVEKLNQVMQAAAYPTTFVSLFIGEVEWDGHFFYVNAGHPAPFVVGDGEIKDLPATGVPLGFVPQLHVNRAYAYLPTGSVLVLYSDGIIERVNPEGEQFGIVRLKELVQQNRDANAEGILKATFEQVFEFGGRAPWEDDATFVIIKRAL